MLMTEQIDFKWPKLENTGIFLSNKFILIVLLVNDGGIEVLKYRGFGKFCLRWGRCECEVLYLVDVFTRVTESPLSLIFNRGTVRRVSYLGLIKFC